MRRGRGVGAESEGRAVVSELAVGEGAFAAVLADEARPGAEDGRVGVDGLDAGGDAQVAEAFGVGLGGEFEVLDPGPAGFVGVLLEDVDRCPDGAIADGMEGDLQTGRVSSGDDGMQDLLRPDRIGIGAGRVRLG